MKKILFQGDSITDALRHREMDLFMGSGYATLVAAQLGYQRPGEFEFVNRGISGNRSIDLLARIKPDILHLAPDYLSILIGVNDIWHDLSRQDGINAQYYELYYDTIIRQTLEALPNIKIMILESFAWEGTGTAAYWEEFHKRITECRKISRKLAEQYGLVFVPLQEKFDEMRKLAPAEYWLHDGVHPTSMGHEIIKREWLLGFEKLEQL